MCVLLFDGCCVWLFIDLVCDGGVVRCFCPCLLLLSFCVVCCAVVSGCLLLFVVALL